MLTSVLDSGQIGRCRGARFRVGHRLTSRALAPLAWRVARGPVVEAPGSEQPSLRFEGDDEDDLIDETMVS